MKYVAIKLIHFPYWLWFKKENVKEGPNYFNGVEGLGRNGAHTTIDVDVNSIVGRINSDSLMYLKSD